MSKHIIHQANWSIQSCVSMKMAGGCVGMGHIRKCYFSHVLVHYLETVSCIKTLSSLCSSLSPSLSLINSVSKPTTDRSLSLFVDFVSHLPSCKHFSIPFHSFHSTGNSLVVINHARIRSARGLKLLPEIPVNIFLVQWANKQIWLRVIMYPFICTHHRLISKIKQVK